MDNQHNNSIIIGIVTNLDDPLKLGRVKVAYPYLNNYESFWARLVPLMGGPDRGTFFQPEPGDEVLIALEQGDYRRPYILGGLWNQPEPPPANDGKTIENNWRFIKSRSGHIFKLDDTPGTELVETTTQAGHLFRLDDTVGTEMIKMLTLGGHLLKLDDTSGAELIEITDKDGIRQVIIDSANEKIQIFCDSGDIEVRSSANSNWDVGAEMTIKVADKIQIICENGDIEVSAPAANVKVEAATLEIKSAGDMTLEAAGKMNIKGATVNIN